MDSEARIGPVTAADRDFWFTLDKHLSGAAFDRLVREGTGYVLSVDGAPAGLLRYSLFWGEIPFCDMLYIRPDCRRQGLGRALMARWMADMKARGCDLALTSTQSDEPAQHFYRALGFTDCGGFILPFPGHEQPLELILGRAL